MALGSCSSPAGKKHVLVVHSYDEAYAGYPETNKLIEKQFRKEKAEVDIRTVYLDCESYREEPELEHMAFLLDSVTRDGWSPEVILVDDDQATYSLLKSPHPLSRSIPVVFSGVNYPNEKLLAENPNVTGFRDRIDINANIQVAKDIFGENVGLFTILDSTYLDRQTLADLARQLKGKRVKGFLNPVNIEGAAENPSEIALKSLFAKTDGYTNFSVVTTRLRQADASLMWALRKYYEGLCYIQLKRDFTTYNIGNISPNPSLTAINEAFGFGEKLLGGYITTLPIQIEEAVESAVRILGGEKPSDIPISESRKEYVVDWKAMQQLDIPPSRIPGNYRIINIPLREKHPLLWITAISLIALLVTALIISLFLLYRREQRRKKQALKDLASEKQTLALAIEGGNTFVWKFEDGHFIFEKAMWESEGLPYRELSFEQMLEIIHPDNRQSVIDNWDPQRIRKRIARMRINFNGEDYQWWEFRYQTQLLDSGEYKTAGLVLNIQDVKNREHELEEARALAEKAELKQSFLANMSHEIRTPLNAIVGFSNILTSDMEIEPEERQLYIDTINRNNELLLKLINDILEISRIESGNMSFEFGDYTVAELIENIYTTHQVLIPEHLEFLRETDPTPMLVHVDRGRLTQVITNFLNNAAKFTESGHIKLGYYHIPDQDTVCIYVEDTGRGIPAEEQKMIFSRFYKRDEFSQGAGLGLSICQVIIERLEGRIELWSEQDKGSRFMVILPYKMTEGQE